MKAWLRRYGGFAVFGALSLLSLVRLLRQAVPGHYRVFSGAGGALYHLQNPYAADFGTGVGYYFYSPACAMMVFGPVSFLPEKLGITVFIAVSWTVFVIGARAFWRAFAPPKNARLLQWFWFAITAQMVGSILASKLEILIAGMLLLSLAWLKENSGRFNARTFSACFLMASTLNWKFQPLPMAGLTMLSWLLIRKDLRVPALIAGLIGFLYLLPFAFFPRDFLLAAHTTWQSSFTTFVQEAYLNFENLFAFLHNAFGIPFSFFATQVVSGVIGLGLAFHLIRWILHQRTDLPGALLLSTALGATFMTALSPLGQNNALILYAPLLIAAFVYLGQSAEPRRLGWIIGACVAVMTLVYSDLVPLGLRNEFRHLSLKSLACLALGIAVIRETWPRIKTT